jgi:hypothetical protein
MNTKEQILRLLDRLEKESYDRGFLSALQAVQTAATHVSAARLPSHTAPELFNLPEAKKPRTRKGATVSAVLSVIKQEPGLRGTEVVARVQAQMPGAMERTVRTSLRRLKLDKAIRNHEGKWYTTDYMTTDELDKLLEGLQKT